MRSAASVATPSDVIDRGDRIFGVPFKALLLRAFVLGKRRCEADVAGRARWHADLHRRLNGIMALTPHGYQNRQLHRRIVRQRCALFTFVTDLDVPPTNNISERQPRAIVIFRKVTNGFCSQ